MKRCRDCGLDKPLEDFSPSKKNKDGRMSHCRRCMRMRSIRDAETRRGGPASRGPRVRGLQPGEEWCARCERALPVDDPGNDRSTHDGETACCRTCHNAATRENVLRNWGSTREHHLRRRYGLTEEQVDAMVEAQGGVCAICRERPGQHVDHDHATGEVRDVLCSCCNQGLGDLRDDPELLRQAAAHVERHRRRQAEQRPAPRCAALPLDALLALPAPRDESLVERRLAAVLAEHVPA